MTGVEWVFNHKQREQREHNMTISRYPMRTDIHLDDPIVIRLERMYRDQTYLFGQLSFIMPDKSIRSYGTIEWIKQKSLPLPHGFYHLRRQPNDFSIALVAEDKGVYSSGKFTTMRINGAKKRGEIIGDVRFGSTIKPFPWDAHHLYCPSEAIGAGICLGNTMDELSTVSSNNAKPGMHAILLMLELFGDLIPKPIKEYRESTLMILEITGI